MRILSIPNTFTTSTQVRHLYMQIVARTQRVDSTKDPSYECHYTTNSRIKNTVLKVNFIDIKETIGPKQFKGIMTKKTTPLHGSDCQDLFGPPVVPLNGQAM